MKYNKIHVILCLLIVSTLSCKKFLDKKSNQKLVTPTAVKDLQGILDNYLRINHFNAGAAEKSADDYYLTTADWSALTVTTDKRIYNWEKDNLFPSGTNDWTNTYYNVYRANLVIEEMKNINIPSADEDAKNTCLGHAYFLRANTFLKAAVIWAPAYDATTAGTDLGIPLRLDPDLDVLTTRASVDATYRQIISDAKTAAGLLPVTALALTRPSKPAAFALIARAYLLTAQFDSCLAYCNKTLQLNNNIKDYNQLTASATFPFAPRFSNPEILYDCYMSTGSILSNTRAKIDSLLYQSYTANDLRKTIFFRNNNNGTYGFKGSYIGAANLFDGLATDEVILMKAECLARTGQTTAAMDALNSLLIKRWKTGTFILYTATTAEEALQKVLQERRKELLMRSIRWMDIKRLNKLGANITIQRVLNNQSFTVSPNDLRYALPIPEEVIAITGIPQNPR